MKKLEISTTATTGYDVRFLVPTLRGSEGGVCPQPVRQRHDATTAPMGSTTGADDLVGGTVATLPGLRTLAPPIT